jgi:outer membrane protein insertion porin family
VNPRPRTVNPAPAPAAHGARSIARACGLALALAAACSAAPALAQPLAPAAPAPQPDALTRAAPPSSDSDAVIPYQDRPIREIRLEGIAASEQQMVRNQIRSRAGSPLSADSVRDDVHRLNRLGRFKRILAKAQAYDDGSIALIFEFVPTPIITDVAVSGNRQISDQDIAAVVSLLKDTPVDEFQLGNAKARILKLYRDKGYFTADVVIDQKELEQTGTVLFKITEGERLRVTDIRFDGAASFSKKEIMSVVKSRIAGILESGPVDPEVLDQDVAAIIAFYKDRGYLDVQADHQLVFAPNSREAIIKFIIREGAVYTLRSIQIESGTPGAKPGETLPLRVFTVEQIAGLLTIKSGDAYSADKLRNAMSELENAFTSQGYVDIAIERREKRDPDKPEVDLFLRIREGERFKTGLVKISGNDVTQKKIILGELDQYPDRPLNLTFRRISGERKILDSERRLSETRLFEPNSVKVTVQPEDPTAPGYRDLLIELKETNTGSLTFGAAVTSDAGLIGSLGLTQRNFDLFDLPDSAGELFSGQAFRGAGQTFDIQLQPGTETQTYQISLSDPRLFDTTYTGSLTGYYRTREYDDYDEARLGFRPSLGRRFGERWTAAVFARLEDIDISNIDENAIVDLFEVEGESTISGVGARLIRSTVDSRFRPSRGTRFLGEVERVGALGGDYEFTKINAEHIVFLTVGEDFLGYRSVLQLKTAMSYIPEGVEEAPIFERYFLGGRSFRGFDFRTISPKGIRQSDGTLTNEPSGGTFSFFAGIELEKPVFKDLVSVAGFIDTGTVDEEFTFDNYRVSAGVGLRLYIAALTPIPFAFDFGFPIVKRYGDRERVFSFSFDIPF